MKASIKKIICVALIAVMLLCSVPFSASAATYSGKCGTNVSWSLNTSTGVLSVTGSGYMTDYDYSSSTPWYSYAYYIRSVNIGNNVKNISDYAFGSCSNISSVTIGDGVIEIGGYAFWNCQNLSSLTIGSSVTSIGYAAFEWCKNLSKVIIPNSVKHIGDYAFFSCNKLKNLTIGNNVTSIGKLAFHGCGLTSLTIPASVSSIHSESFSYCRNLTNITVSSSNKYYSNNGDGVLFNKNQTKLIMYPLGNARTSYTFPESVTSIGDHAFYYGSNLKTLTIPDRITSIGDYAFAASQGLQSVTIGEGITSIGDHTFNFCPKLTELAIGKNVTNIDTYAFGDCNSLESIVLPDGLKTIKYGAFSGCDSLKSILIPGSVTSIESGAFGMCDSLEYIHIPSSLKNIEQDILHDTSAYICSTTEDCYAKTYADANGLKFKKCNGHGIRICDREFENNLDYYAKNLVSSAYDPTLANMMAALSKAVYSESDIKSAYKSLGFSNCSLYDYGGTFKPSACGYAIDFKTSEYSNEIICLITVRGSNNTSDWVGNFNINTKTTTGGKHPGFSNPADRIYQTIQKYKKDTNNYLGNIKYFITGHSRGAAVANLLAVKLMENGDFASHIYNYNFACPDVACRTGFGSYTNIFNLCNDADAVPFLPGKIGDSIASDGTGWGKFGQTYWFTQNTAKNKSMVENLAKNHSMDSYLKFFDKRLDTSLWDDEKIVANTNVPIGYITNVHCPVDVTITDTDNNLIASVIGSEVNYYNSVIGDVIIFTDGDEKAIYIDGDKNYNVNLVGTDTGEMTYSVEHYNITTEDVLESKIFSNIKLEEGKKMISSVTSMGNMSEIELLVTKEENGKDIITHSVDTDGTEIESYWRNVERTKVTTPSTTTVNYGETLVLRVEDVILPAKYTVEWIVDGSGFSKAVSEDGLECMLTSNASGTATVTVRIVDENGEAVLDGDGNEISDSIELKSNAGFFQKLISFFKNLFRMNRVIY